MDAQNQPGRKNLRDDDERPCFQGRNERKQACELKARRNPDQRSGDDAAEQCKPGASRPEFRPELMGCVEDFRIGGMYTIRCVCEYPDERDNDAEGCEEKRESADRALETYIPHLGVKVYSEFQVVQVKLFWEGLLCGILFCVIVTPSA